MDDAYTVCALVAYDGADYHGFQAQANAPSIQQALEDALDRCAERCSRVTGAGRTDAGVHATGQVIAVAVRWRHSLAALQRAWNVHLSPAIAVRSVQTAPPGFHPRFSALSRTYRYTVQCGGQEGRAAVSRSPLTRRYAWFEARALDVAAMNEVSATLIGEHDFATFGWPPQGEKTVRVVEAAHWTWVQETPPALGSYAGPQVVFTITANAFLRQMVRSLVGALLAVGRGDWSAQDFAAAWAAADRRRAAPPAASHGLVLENVAYPEHLAALIFEKERSMHRLQQSASQAPSALRHGKENLRED